jgi:hypothetical protein
MNKALLMNKALHGYDELVGRLIPRLAGKERELRLLENNLIIIFCKNILL